MVGERMEDVVRRERQAANFGPWLPIEDVENSMGKDFFDSRLKSAKVDIALTVDRTRVGIVSPTKAISELGFKILVNWLGAENGALVMLSANYGRHNLLLRYYEGDNKREKPAFLFIPEESEWENCPPAQSWLKGVCVNRKDNILALYCGEGPGEPLSAYSYAFISRKEFVSEIRRT